MTLRTVIGVGGITALLWVVPSIGTQGMGTVGERVAHPDAALFDADPASRPLARAMLSQADDVSETAAGL